MQGPRLIPTQPLGGGWTASTVGAAKALGPQANGDGMAKDREVAQQNRVVKGMLLGERAPALRTDGRIQGTFHRDNEFTVLRQLGLEHAHVGQI